MADFEKEWNKLFENNLTFKEKIPPTLKRIVGDVYLANTTQPVLVERIVDAVESLLEFLTTPEGRTDINCQATNLFFAVADGWNWDSMPDELVNIVSDIGMTLYGTVSNPEIAKNFESTPEQLLERLWNSI